MKRNGKVKAKFRMGQVVRVEGSDQLMQCVPRYFKIVEVEIGSTAAIYKVHESGPWINESPLHPLTKQESGR